MVEFRARNKLITKEELEAFEQQIDGLKLPEDYREHMLKYNGGNIPLWKNYVFIDKKEELFLAGFYPIRYGDSNVEKYYNHKHDFLYPKLLPIGAITGGYLAIGCQDNNKGEIHVYFSDDGPYKIANSFTEFIENLEIREV